MNKTNKKQKKIATAVIRTLMVVGLALASILSMAQSDPGQTPQTPEATPTTQNPSMLESIGDFFKKLKPDSPAQAQLEPGGKPIDAANPDSASPRALKLIDIDKWSSQANTVLDPECKVMAQPFSIDDNAASLALFATKLKAQEVLSKVLGQPTVVFDIKSAVKMAARSLNWMPMTLEVELGNRLLKNEEFLEENKNPDVRRTYMEARAVLAEIVKDLPEEVPYNFQIYVRPTSYGNASALPSGIILVDRDLFKKGANPDHARFVIAHEVAHILQRHQTRMYQARLADGIDSIENFRKLIGGANSSNPNMMLAQASLLKKLFVSFTEDQELQADSCAVRLMSKRYPDPRVLDRKLDEVSQKFGPIVAEQIDGPANTGLAEVAKYLGDGVFERHPNSDKRRGNLKRISLLTTATK